MSCQAPCPKGDFGLTGLEGIRAGSAFHGAAGQAEAAEEFESPLDEVAIDATPEEFFLREPLFLLPSSGIPMKASARADAERVFGFREVFLVAAEVPLTVGQDAVEADEDVGPDELTPSDPKGNLDPIASAGVERRLGIRS
jgi:hypothetical protein